MRTGTCRTFSIAATLAYKLELQKHIIMRNNNYEGRTKSSPRITSALLSPAKDMNKDLAVFIGSLVVSAASIAIPEIIASRKREKARLREMESKLEILADIVSQERNKQYAKKEEAEARDLLNKIAAAKFLTQSHDRARQKEAEMRQLMENLLDEYHAKENAKMA